MARYHANAARPNLVRRAMTLFIEAFPRAFPVRVRLRKIDRSKRDAKKGLPISQLSEMVLHMENFSAGLDAAFHSLAHPARRAVISRLARGPMPVKELAKPFAMGLPSFMKHLRILEQDGLITSEKVGRVRTCRVNTPKLTAAERWLNEQRQLWQSSADRLADYVENRMQRIEDDA